MIDSQSEHIVTFYQAADDLPRRRRGRKTHISTRFRWSTAGCKGVVLETIQVGGTRCTSREALQRFFESLSQPVQVGAVGGDARIDNSSAGALRMLKNGAEILRGQVRHHCRQLASVSG